MNINNIIVSFLDSMFQLPVFSISSCDLTTASSKWIEVIFLSSLCRRGKCSSSGMVYPGSHGSWWCVVLSILKTISQLNPSQMGQLFFCVIVSAFLDPHGILLLYFSGAGQSMFYCDQAWCGHQAGLSAASAVPRSAPAQGPPLWDVPSPTYVAASFQTPAQELVKVKPGSGVINGSILLLWRAILQLKLEKNGKAVSRHNFTISLTAWSPA